jgi:ATP phosphoribosyltransferase regulatory subunit HisZ
LVKLGDVGLFRAIVAASGLHTAYAQAVVRGFSAAGGVAAALAAAEKPAPVKEGALGRALAALDDPEAAAAAVEDLWAAARITPVGARTSAEVAERLKAKAAAARAPQPKPEQIGFIRAALAIEAAPDDALAALAALAKSTAGANAKALSASLGAAQTRWAGLSKLKPNARLSAGYGRGPGYYDGGLFELEAPALGDLASLGGGGRYDAVLARLAGDAAKGLSAAGFALRPQRLLLAREAGA